MEAELFPAEFFRALEALARRPPDRGPGSASARRAGQGRPGYEHRSSRPGDDARRVDWRATARSGQLQVRKNELERGGDWLLVLDRSASLAPGSGRRDRDQRRLALALGWQALDAGGSAALVAGPGPPRRVEGRARRAALQHVLEELPAPAGGEARAPEEALAGGGRRRVVLLGDPWSGPEWWNLAGNCAHRGDEVWSVVLVLPAEDEPPREKLLVHAVEGGGQLEVDLLRDRAVFAGRWRAQLAGLRGRAHELGVQPFELRCGRPGSDAASVLRSAEEAGLV